MKEENYVETFIQRCLKCSHIQKIDIEQKAGKPMRRPKKYECPQCNHKGIFGEQTVAPKPISLTPETQTISDASLPPVIDEDGKPCLVVDGKRVPFTLGRIQLLKKDIALKMTQLDQLEKVYERELKE